VRTTSFWKKLSSGTLIFKRLEKQINYKSYTFRDRPFNLQGEGWGWGLWFFFRLEIFFRTTRELGYLFFYFFPEFNIRLYDKNSESYYFFSSTKIRIFFLQHWESEYFFLEKKHNPPPHQVKWSFPKISIEKSNNIEEYY
jgi:hypothetical protein